MSRFVLPDAVAARARAMGPEGVRWIERLDETVAALENQWKISAGEPMTGGTHALVVPARGEDGAAYILKVDVPDLSEEEYMNEMRTLLLADGNGYVKLYRLDAARRASLMERLGPRLKALDFPVNEQIGIICRALNQSWSIPADGAQLSRGADSIGWFCTFIPGAWEKAGRPCSGTVVRRAMEWLTDRENHMDPSRWVLVHGDAHNNNTLQCLDDPSRFKLIDPDGVYYEREYDLGVLMREWPEVYDEDPVARGMERAQLLSRLTGAEVRGVLAWGYLQMVSTSLVLIDIGQRPLAEKMLGIAEAWAQGFPHPLEKQ